MGSEASRLNARVRAGLRQREAGRFRDAEREFRAVLAADADHYAANYSLGMLYHHLGRNDLAIPLLSRSVELEPEVFAGLLNLGMIQREEDLFEAAQQTLQKAVALEPDSGEAHVTLGLLLMDRGRFDEALSEMEQGLRLDPGEPMTHGRLGMLHQARGDPQAAAACYRKLIELEPGNGTAHRSLAFLKRQTELSEDIRKMEAAFTSRDISDRDRMMLGNALGKVYDDLGRYDEAFSHLQESGRLQRKAYGYSVDRQKAFFDRHRQWLDGALLSHCESRVVEDPAPIFVVGMPRSGTSLVEQILASHPQAYGAGEVEYTRLLVDAVETVTRQPFPEEILAVAPNVIQNAAQAYVDKLKLNAGPAERVIDKLPHNFLRVGLIAAVLPKAKIVSCKRDPLDNCVSIYQHLFGPAHAYATDLHDLGEYYRLYRQLMDRWEELLPGHMLHVEYEDLVTDTESQVRRLLQYCGLPYHGDCLAFHRTRRQVKTPSSSQVRQPIYRGSIGRWKNYEKHLGPLIEALGPAAL